MPALELEVKPLEKRPDSGLSNLIYEGGSRQLYLGDPKVRRLVLACEGRIDFQKAVDIASETKGDDVKNALVRVAREMVDVGIPPTSALERITTIRDGISIENDLNGAKRRSRNFMELGMAEMLGMLGRHEEMKSLVTPPQRHGTFWTIRPYIFAAEEQVRRGEDPTPILEETMDIISGTEPDFGTSEEYTSIARVLYKANLDPKIPFAKAEEILDPAKTLQQEATPITVLTKNWPLHMRRVGL